MNLKIPVSGLLVVLLLGACASPTDRLEVKQFVLRDELRKGADDPMVRNEKLRRLHGAVSMAERKQNLGQYYTLVWNDPDGKDQGNVDVVFEYQQGASASRVKRMSKSFPSGDTQGEVEFAVIGDDYFKNGRVLAWRAVLLRNEREVASKRSYLWR